MRAIVLAACALALVPFGVAAQDTALKLVAKYPIPHMTGTWDHLAGDAKGGRLFLTAQDEHAVDVLDVVEGKLLTRMTGSFNRPQGQLYIPELKRLVTANGRDGAVRFTDTQTYKVANTVQLGIGADLMQYDAARKVLYIESGGKDSNRGTGKISIVDAVDGAIHGEIVTDYRAAAMALERSRPRLYVAVPALHQVLLVDTRTNAVAGKFDIPGRPGFIGLDERHRRLFVSTRQHPSSHAQPTFNVFDTESGRRIAVLPTIEDTSGLAYDAMHCRIYTSGLSGFVHAIRQVDPDHYESLARIATGHHAGTSFWMPERNRFFVAVPPFEGREAQVWAFEPMPGRCAR